MNYIDNAFPKMSLLKVALNYMMASQQRLNIINALLFQANWFICIFMPSSMSALSTLCLLILHFCIFSRQSKEWLMLFVFAIVGFFCDSLLQFSGLISFSHAVTLPLSSNFSVTLAPMWLLFLWISFATCLNHCLAYLQQRLWLALALIIIAIPFNYYMGALITESQFLAPVPMVLFAVSAYWAALFPLFLYLFNKNNRASSLQTLATAKAVSDNAIADTDKEATP